MKLLHFFKKPEIKILIFLSFFIVLIAYTIQFNTKIKGEQQFVLLSQSFLSGKVSLDVPRGSVNDVAEYNGKQYWPEAPFPAVLISPFVFVFNKISLNFYQGYANILILILVIYLVFNISKNNNYSKKDSLFLSFTFVFSSMFIGVISIGWSWYFSQVVAVLFLLLAINEYYGKKRYFLIGVYMAAVIATRSTAGLGLVFFLLQVALSGENLRIIAKKLFIFLSPIAITTLVLFTYNYVRFQNIFEFGYSLCYLGTYENMETSPLNKAREYGMFHPIHVPGNLYYSLLSLPTPIYKDSVTQVLKFPYLAANPWGISIFFTSPFLFYLLVTWRKSKNNIILLLTILTIALPIFLYYGIGYRQFGYRYGLDFFPFLFLLFLINYKAKYNQLSGNIKRLVIISALLNMYLFLTIFFYALK